MIQIVYEQFPEEIKLSSKRRARYFTEDDSLPKKYLIPNSTVILQPQYIWKPKDGEKTLWNHIKKEWVVKNPGQASTPRFFTIAGNDIMRCHEMVRNKVVNALKEHFIEKLGKVTGEDKEGNPTYSPIVKLPTFPLSVSMEVHTFPRLMNWDTDNLWIYTKCFLDALALSGALPNDNIRFVKRSGGVEFFPVSREEDRKMVFNIGSASDSSLNHLMYFSQVAKGTQLFCGGPTPFFQGKNAFRVPFESFDLDIVREGSAGDVVIEMENEKTGYPRITINVGKTDKLIAVDKALTRVRHQCFQLNMIPFVDNETWERLAEPLTENFLKEGIPIYIDKDEREPTKARV